MSYPNSVFSKDKSTSQNSKNSLQLTNNSLSNEYKLNNLNKLIKTEINQQSYKNSRSISISSDIEHLSFNHNEEDEQESDEFNTIDNAYQVDICSLKPIQEEDLEAILLLLENPKRSGGGEITSYELMQNNHLLKITYEKRISKQRVLQKCVHQFKQYKLIANDSALNSLALTRNRKYQQLEDKRTIILKNLPNNIDLDMIRLYGEYLVMNDNELNDVEDILLSNLFKNTCYIKFKLDYDYDKLIERVNKRKLNNHSLEIMQTYNTNMILIKLNNDFKTKLNSLDYDFNKYPFKSINESLVLTHGNKEIISNLVNIQDDIDSSEFSIEYLYNYDLLLNSDELVNNDEKNSSDSSSIETTQQLSSSSICSSSFINLSNELIKFKLPLFNHAKEKITNYQDKIINLYRSSPLEHFFIINKKWFITFLMTLFIIINAQIFYGIILNPSSIIDNNKQSFYSYKHQTKISPVLPNYLQSNYNNIWYLFY